MADFSEDNVKEGIGDVYPDNVIETPFQFLEPIITPRQLRRRFLRGIPLVSSIPDPRTKRLYETTDEDLQDDIIRAISVAETMTGIDIMERERKERHPLDVQEWKSFGYFRLRHAPVSRIRELVIDPTHEIRIFSVPLKWIDTGYLHQGQFNIVPLVSGYASGGQVFTLPGNADSAFLHLLGARNWIPAYWSVVYSSGFPDNKVPTVVNELIGCLAAMENLSMLAASNTKTTGQSLSLDGMSQSISSPGPNLYKVRHQELEEKANVLKNKIKAMFVKKIFVGNV